MNQIEKNSLLIVAGTALFMIMFGIGSIPLLDPDEPVYAETAREMLAAGDFLSPRIFGNFWYDKPRGSDPSRACLCIIGWLLLLSLFSVTANLRPAFLRL